MASHGEEDTVVRLPKRSGLLPPARKAGPEASDDGGEKAEAGEKLVALPEPGSHYETAYARPNNKPLGTLRLIIGDAVRGLAYANLDACDLVPSDKPGGGPAIVLLFTGIVARKAVITGRHLLLMYDLLCDHRIAWLRELPKGRDFKDKDATVITGITLELLKEFPA